MMTDLIIKNFAIIDHLHVTFESGFTVLTGETGAGKSIIIDAVNLLLGGRARGDVIRTDAESASVEAVFALAPQAPLRQRLSAAELPVDDELVVRRTLSRSGKNRAFVNGSLVPVGQLRELIGDLVNIYGQHEHQTLQRPELHLALLDEFAGLAPELATYQWVYKDYSQLQDDLARFEIALRERRQRIDYLSFVQHELAEARLQAAEDVELEQERRLLQHAEKLTLASSGGYASLYGNEQSVCEQVGAVADQLDDLRTIDPGLGGLSERLRESLYNLEDVALQLRDYGEKLEFEPHRQEQVEERLALLERLKRKYAPSLVELIDFEQRIGQELEDLNSGESRREDLQRRCDEKKQALTAAAKVLSHQRQQAAQKLAAAVEAQLAELAMPRARFEMRLNTLAQPGPDGVERGEFYLAANPGEQAQPLSKIASGGELSRIMLALRRCAPVGDDLITLIFDEVDAGIGGEAATAVGEKIRRTGRDLQVLCVTHLPQVAAFADHHCRVSKTTSSERTTTLVEALGDAQREHEIARMLGGSHIGEQAQIHARELISLSQRPIAG
ncbi:DNA repair protein RecN [Pelovirga terrestris]|uniref:DNA repair protein RecN n=1 Tax=Pelovirga terrestris TaxID=2771352 RepID=A0A8J6UQN9_9BACT|nr:DNA repair protein RecN [Pelovirga terrestris]MBD1399376.1 DNA repair protein RecN [Pelovirga terrestris]